MSWATHYIQPDTKLWQGRSDSPDASCFFQIIRMLDLSKDVIPHSAPEQAFGLIGFSCDEGIKRNQGRQGAAEGPDTIRQVLAKMPIQNTDFMIYDAGTVTCTNGDLEGAQKILGEAVAKLLENNITPIVMGGGHELAWGHFQGIAKHYPTENLGIINFDAHFDMRPTLENHLGSSGTPFLQMAEAHKETNRRFDYNCIGIQPAGNLKQLFDTAKHYDVQSLLADDVYQDSSNKCLHFINSLIMRSDAIYLSLCLDVFAVSFAPGVSAPQAFGLTPWQVLPMVRQLAASGKVVSYDIAELSPKYDIDNRTAKLAASFIYEITHHHKATSSGNLNDHHQST
jgi:formiminoglutamase